MPAGWSLQLVAVGIQCQMFCYRYMYVWLYNVSCLLVIGNHGHTLSAIWLLEAMGVQYQLFK